MRPSNEPGSDEVKNVVGPPYLLTCDSNVLTFGIASSLVL